MIAFLRILILVGTVCITACGFFMLSLDPFGRPLAEPLIIIATGIFLFVMMFFRVGEVD